MKKPGLAVLIGEAKPDEEESDDGAEVDLDAEEENAADALIEAVHAKDAAGVVKAQRALYDLCAAKHEEGEAAEEE